ncbi:MAG: choice-of-anchor Q domain-containing protein [Verrucomicrobiales bacterium]|nr:choice-of-anchor Q domain-containing protein [Verrucomicrobiales bacterium]
MRLPFYLCRFLALAGMTTGFLRADTFEVTLLDDAGAGSLRAAIAAANANAGDDTITFVANLNNDFIFLDTGTLVITDTTGKTTIDASSLPNGIFIDGFGLAGQVRVFEVAAGADVEMRNLEISSGAAPNGADGASGAAPSPGDDGEDGGGIYNEGTLALYNCRVTGNLAGNGGRGGDVSGNGAAFSGAGGNGGRGGGIFSTGDQASVSLFDCLVSGNDAGSGGDAGDGDIGTPSAGGNGGNGGGIYSDDRSKLRVVRTVISNNDAGQGGVGGQPGAGVVGGRGGDGGNGGGVGISVPVQDDDGNGTVYPLFEDCTISQNNTGGGLAGAAIGGAGGDDSGSLLDIGGPGGNGGNGGGIWVESFATSDPGTVHLSGCLIRDNKAGSGEDGGDRSSDDTTNGSDGGDGGSGAGVFVSSSLGSNQVWTMRNCTVTGNESGPGGSGGTGGANGTGGGGGDAGNGGGLAFAVGGNDYTAELVHLTIYDNDAGSSGSGGGADSGGTAGTAGNGGEGGGVWDGEIVLFDSGVVYQNTIVALNTADSDTDIKGGQRAGSTANLVGNSPNPLLDGLSDLGGPTQVLPPLVDSPAINGGAVLANPVTTDQRGFPRPQGGAPDIGAVEIGFQPDVKIGKKSNPASHRRNNYYSASAAGQNLTLKLAGRRKGKSYFSVESDGDITETVTVRGTKPNRTLRLKAFRLTGGKTNVTARLATGLPLTDMEPGSTVLFRVDVKARSKKKKPRQNLKYSAKSQVVPAADAVRLKVRQQSGSFF